MPSIHLVISRVLTFRKQHYMFESFKRPESLSMVYYVDIVKVNICIVCNSGEGIANIFTDSLEGEGVLLHEALEFITCLKVDRDENEIMSLCVTCNGRLLDAYRFKNQALESYKTLQDIGAQTEVRIIDKNEEESEPDFLVVGGNNITSDLSPVLSASSEKPDVDMSTDAVTFLIEHHLNNISKDKLQTEEVAESKEQGEVKKKTEVTKPIGRAKLKHECDICGKQFPKKSNLIDHIRLHANEKKFVCSYCDKSFVQIANFRMHERIHTKERPYECHICSKSYSQSSTLKIHIRSHTQERNYFCSVCNKAFTNASDRNKHERVHDPSKHFKCEFCGKEFVQKVNMKVHQRKMHAKEVNS